MSRCPRARQEGLIVSAAGDETIVYDGKTDKVYLLNATSAAVWNASNGERSAAALASYLSVKTPVTERVVWYALGQLQDLLEEPVTLPHEIAGVSRRKFLKLSGVVAAGVTLPSVVRMVAPSVASAQSPDSSAAYAFRMARIRFNRAVTIALRTALKHPAPTSHCVQHPEQPVHDAVCGVARIVICVPLAETTAVQLGQPFFFIFSKHLAVARPSSPSIV